MSDDLNKTPQQETSSNLQSPSVDAVVKSTSHVKSSASNIFTIIIIAALIISIAFSFYLWRKLTNIQEHLARQSADATNLSIEARGLAKNAQEVAREAAAKSTLIESRLNEVALQRNQLDDILQNLARNRDENLATDIESTLRSMQQFAQITGSVEPLITALKYADQRLKRSSQPRLNILRSTLANDLEKIQSSTFADIPNLVSKFDDISRLLETIPFLNSATATLKKEKKDITSPVNSSKLTKTGKAGGNDKSDNKLTQHFGIEEVWQTFRDELYKLIRVSKVENIDAVLLSPEQSYVLRENLKLRVQNARLSLLSRQFQSVKTDLTFVSEAVRKYADTNSTQSQSLINTISQVHSQLNNTNIPNIDATLAALTQASVVR